MSALPPDVPRLRAILRHLEQQIAENETVGVYLRLQREAVAEALAHTEGQAAQQPSPGRGQRAATLTGFTSSARGPEGAGFAVERQRRAIGPEPTRIHTDDCTNSGPSHPITAQDARAALLDSMVEACPFCRPDTLLGIDVD